MAMSLVNDNYPVRPHAKVIDGVLADRSRFVSSDSKLRRLSPDSWKEGALPPHLKIHLKIDPVMEGWA